MALIRDESVVLTRLDYSETSQIIVLFTRQHGRVRAIAKGIKRGTKTRFATGIDLLDIGSVVVSSRQERSASLATVTEWKQTRSLSGLREKLARIQAAQYAAEVTEHLTEDWDPHVELFDALVTTLTDLSGAPEALGPIVAYQRQLLEAIGSMPRFHICMHCGRGDELTHLSSFEGGMVCRHCEPGQVEKWEVSEATLKTLQQPPQGSDHTGAEPRPWTGAFGALNYHISHLMGRAPLLASKLVPTLQQRRIE